MPNTVRLSLLVVAATALAAFAACTAILGDFTSGPTEDAAARDDSGILASATGDGAVHDALFDGPGSADATHPLDAAVPPDTGALTDATAVHDASPDTRPSDASLLDAAGDAGPALVCTTTSGQAIGCYETTFTGGLPYFSFYCSTLYRTPCTQCDSGVTCAELSAPPDAGGAIVIYGTTSLQ